VSKRWIWLMCKALFLIALAGFSLTIPLPAARADDASLGAVGYGVVPLNNDQVTMAAERVEAEMRGDQAWVTCTFTFHNTGAAAEVLMGFPQAQASAGEASQLLDFRAFVDSEQVPVTFRPNAQPQGEWDYAGWHSFTVPFAAGQIRTVRNTYHGRLTLQSDGGRVFEYVLHTGATWLGPIGRADVVVRWQRDRDVLPETLSASPAGHIQGRHELRWHFTDLEPTRGNDIQVYFRPAYGPHNLGIAPIFWGRQPPSQSKHGLPPVPLIADGDPATAWRLVDDTAPTWIGWGYGGFSHYASPTLGLGILPGVASDAEAFSAHGRPKVVLIRLAHLKEGEQPPPTVFPSPLLFTLDPGPALEITEHRLTLDDAPRWQFLRLEEPATVLAFQVVVENAYLGQRYDDVAIAEVLFPLLEEDLASPPPLLPAAGSRRPLAFWTFWVAGGAALVLAVFIRKAAVRPRRPALR